MTTNDDLKARRREVMRDESYVAIQLAFYEERDRLRSMDPRTTPDDVWAEQVERMDAAEARMHAAFQERNQKPSTDTE